MFQFVRLQDEAVGRARTLRGFRWRCIALLIALTAKSGLAAESETLPADSATSQPSKEPGNVLSVKDEAIQDLQLLNMEVPTVITASRHEQKITTVPYAMTVITKEEIRAMGARSVPDALRLVPGVNIADLSYASAAVNIRGPAALLSRELLVLVDGRQIFDSLFGGTPWAIWPFQLEDIERIEVIRGPAGVTWGANAVNGVINIITKDPRDQLGVTAVGGGGSRGSNREHLGYGFEDGKLQMRISGEHEGSDGFDKGGVFTRPLDDCYEAGRTAVHAIYDRGPDDRLTISGGNGTVRGGIPPAPQASFVNEGRAFGYASYVLGRWDHKITQDNSFNLTAFVNDSYECPGNRQLQYRYDQFALQFSHTFKPAEEHTITWGVDTRADYLDSHHADPYMLTEDYLGTGIFGVYIQDEWQFAPRWRLNSGARIDYDCYGGFQPSGRLALSYDLNDTSLIYGAVSRAFQMPPLGSRFLNVPLLGGLAYATADREVKSIQLISYELGYRGKPSAKLETSAALFCHDYDDLTVMRLMPGPPGLIQTRFMNAYDAYIYGIELDAKYAVSKQLMLLGNYTFERMDTFGIGSESENDIMSLPRHKFMVGAHYRPIERLLLSSQLYFVDDVTGMDPGIPASWTRRHISEYFRLDLRAEYEFWKDHGSVAVGVQNLLDPDHPEGTSGFQNVAEVPRMIYAEMRISVDPTAKQVSFCR